MNAKDEFYSYATEKVQDRVRILIKRYLAQREIFEDAHDIEPAYFEESQTGDALHYIVERCIAIVAPEWKWSVKYEDNGDQNVWVTEIAWPA